MNAIPIFWRFLWKEYRVMRAFWISMAVLAMLAQLALWAYPRVIARPAVWTFSIALFFPALYAVACGATMFAAEREEGTYEFLRGLPVTAWRILSGKLAFAIASALLLIVALRLTAGIVSDTSAIDAHERLQLWATFGLAAVEGLAWGMFFSLVLRRPLQAAVLAMAAVSLATHVILWRVAPVAGEAHIYDLERYLGAVPVRLLVAAIIFLADGLLVRRWLTTRISTERSLFRRRPRMPAVIATTAAAQPLPPSRSAVFGRLVWQTWRQSRWMMVTLAVPGTVGVFLALGIAHTFITMPVVQSIFSPYAGAALVGALIGSGVFLADNERRSARFLAHHGVRARRVWLARDLVWLAALLIWIYVLHVLEFALLGAFYVSLFGGITSAIIGFACGQFAAMAVRSGLLAATVAIILVALCLAWASFMQLLGINWLWSLLPIPAALFVATWVRAPDWMLERNTWRGWLRVAAAPALTLVALLIAVPLYRTYQIPAVSPGFSPDEFARAIKPTAEEEKTADMFESAAAMLVRSPVGTDHGTSISVPDTWTRATDAEFLKMNAKALGLALTAAKRPTWSSRGKGNQFQSWPLSWPVDLVTLLEASARQLESDGKLDDAWERHVAALRLEGMIQSQPWTYDQLPIWAAHPGQTRERIVAAIKQLEQFDATLRPPTDAVKSEYLRLQPLMNDGPDALAGHGGRAYAGSPAIWAMMPWERSRAVRLLNLVTADDLQILERTMDAVARGKPTTDMLRDPNSSFYIEYPQYLKSEPMQRYRYEGELLRTTFLLSAFYYPSQNDGDALGWDYLRNVTERRATYILMALEAWKADHLGVLPERLDELVGLYLERLPLDPYSGKEFFFARKGLRMPPTYRETPPFIWTIGRQVRQIDGSDRPPPVTQLDTLPAETIIFDGREWRRTTDGFDVRIAGWRFYIP